MTLRDGLVLYHGSYVEVPRPDLSKCARFKDFGQGFYLTTSARQARNFVALSVRKAQDRGDVRAVPGKGFVSSFVVEGEALDYLRVLEFQNADSEWLACVVAHRRRRSFPELVSRYAHYDVIAGKIANDRTNITLALYMDGIFGPVGSPDAARACIAQLVPERLKDQYCFRSARALGCLAYVGSEAVWT